MKAILKIYAACCAIIIGFFVFFSIPFGLLPFSDAVNLIVVGVVILLIPGIHLFYTLRREAFDLGEYLARRGGFWMIVASLFGLIAIGCGALAQAAPELFTPAFEQGALPFGILLVSMFWIALIVLMAFPAFGFISIVAGNIRFLRFKGLPFNLFFIFVCLGLSTVFVSLYLEVINDIAIQISEATRGRLVCLYVASMFLIGSVHGIFFAERNLEKAYEM